MAQNKKGLLPKVEMFIIALLLIVAIVIIGKKCKSMESRFEQPEKPVSETTSFPVDTASIDTLVAVDPNKKVTPFNPWEYSRLYVTINDLNMRKSPELDGDLITKLSLFEEVFFLNEVTDSTQKINLGKEIADEPWVKIKTKKGKEGWVYGAGVNYYKKKRGGVME
ncbi:SH3 domain-containing protein [Saprospiraceae bacterium]|jgi:hypothetical protein|nr:SH3 domain-containing protein [Bacteroidota bacterium]MDB4727813.1 SH3 domain-containing protein [Saprospiraceae bacterium]MDF1868393.1 SH3 domain-containing protein [Saprospiraceae bacterium]